MSDNSYIRGTLDVSGEVEWYGCDEGFANLWEAMGESLGDYPKLQITSTPMEENMSNSKKPNVGRIPKPSILDDSHSSYQPNWAEVHPSWRPEKEIDDTQEIDMVECPDCRGTGKVDVSVFRKKIVDCVSCISGRVTKEKAQELRDNNSS